MTECLKNAASDAVTRRTGTVKAVIETVFRRHQLACTVRVTEEGGVVDRFGLRAEPGVAFEAVAALAPELARELGVAAVRVTEYAIDRTFAGWGIEVPHPPAARQYKTWRELTESECLESTGALEVTLLLGATVLGEPVAVDLATLPHLVIAGGEKTGKTTLMHSLILSLLTVLGSYERRLVLIDVESGRDFAAYEGVAQLLCPVIAERQKGLNVLRWLVKEIDRRRGLLAALPDAKTFEDWNRTVRAALDAKTPLLNPAAAHAVLKPLPRLVCLVHDVADLLTGPTKDAEPLLRTILENGAAVGIHLILMMPESSGERLADWAALCPARIGLAMTERQASESFLGTEDAVKLVRPGDLLFRRSPAHCVVRLQSPRVTAEDIASVVESRLWLDAERQYVKDVTERNVTDIEKERARETPGMPLSGTGNRRPSRAAMLRALSVLTMFHAPARTYEIVRQAAEGPEDVSTLGDLAAPVATVRRFWREGAVDEVTDTGVADAICAYAYAATGAASETVEAAEAAGRPPRREAPDSVMSRSEFAWALLLGKIGPKVRGLCCWWRVTPAPGVSATCLTTVKALLTALGVPVRAATDDEGAVGVEVQGNGCRRVMTALAAYTTGVLTVKRHGADDKTLSEAAPVSDAVNPLAAFFLPSVLSGRGRRLNGERDPVAARLSPAGRALVKGANE